MKKFEKKFEKWTNINIELSNVCLEYINDTLSKIPNNEINFDDDSIWCFVTYNGGNHPEYDTNPFSIVERVYIKNGNIYLDTEDCTDYPIEEIYAEEKYRVAKYIKEYIEKNFEL